MAEHTNWRLQGLAATLSHARLVRRAYRPPSDNPAWDHDHCEFCGARFMVAYSPGVLRQGYATLDESHWICAACFTQFQVLFGFTVVSEPDPALDA